MVDKVNDDASRSDRSIPGVIETKGTPSTSDSSELSTTQALIVSLTASLVGAEKYQYIPLTAATAEAENTPNVQYLSC